MMRLQADIAEIQGLAQAQAQREQPFTGIAAQWSAANAGMGSSPLGPLAQANPLPGGLGASAAASGPSAPRMTPQQGQTIEQEDEQESSWQGQAAGAATGALSGAALGTQILPGWGTAAGAVIGGLGGYLQAGG